MNLPPVQSIFNQQASETQAEIQRGFITRVYGWMTFGLILTALAAVVTLYVPGVLDLLLSNTFIFLGLLGAELIVVVVLSAAVNRLSPAVAGLLFIGYAVLNGVSLSLLVLIYTTSSIAVTFGVTAATFGIMTLFGATTHRDLTKLGSLLIMALIGMIIASVVNIFLGSSTIYWITTFIGILIFTGLVAYDTQRLKRMSLVVGDDGMAQKASVLGALALYLDFINIFLLLLRVLGRRR
jgi:FtsH-binding integral membrane protein